MRTERLRRSFEEEARRIQNELKTQERETQRRIELEIKVIRNFAKYPLISFPMFIHIEFLMQVGKELLIFFKLQCLENVGKFSRICYFDVEKQRNQRYFQGI